MRIAIKISMYLSLLFVVISCASHKKIKTSEIQFHSYITEDNRKEFITSIQVIDTPKRAKLKKSKFNKKNGKGMGKKARGQGRAGGKNFSQKRKNKRHKKAEDFAKRRLKLKQQLVDQTDKLLDKNAYCFRGYQEIQATNDSEPKYSRTITLHGVCNEAATQADIVSFPNQKPTDEKTEIMEEDLSDYLTN